VRIPLGIGLIALTLVALVGATTATSADRTSASSASTCRGTLPNHRVQPDAGFGRDGFNYGNAQLRAHLNWKNGWLKAGMLPDGGSTATVNADGSIRTKQGWWRGPRGKLVISGRRLDGPPSAWRMNTSTFYGDQGFIPVIVTFPTTGCWRVTGILGTAKLTYVVRVTKVPGQ
jgi:hypothetical protein